MEIFVILSAKAYFSILQIMYFYLFYKHQKIRAFIHFKNKAGDSKMCSCSIGGQRNERNYNDWNEANL